MKRRTSKYRIHLRYFSQSCELITELTLNARVSAKTSKVSLVGTDISTIMYAPSYKGDYYLCSRSLPNHLPNRLLLPPEGEVAVVYGGNNPSLGIVAWPTALRHLPVMNNNLVEFTEITYTPNLLEKMRGACQTAKTMQEHENESWRRKTERSKYVHEQRIKMLEAHAMVNRLMNSTEAYATDEITKSDYLRNCSEFWDSVYAFDCAQKGALLRWPENVASTCLGDAGDLGELVLGINTEGKE